MITIYILAGFIIGVTFEKISRNLSIKLRSNKEVKSLNAKFNLILQKIRNKNSRFKTRINNTVYVAITLPDYGKVDIVYLMDKKDIAVFQNGKCILTSDHIEKSTINDIIVSIEDRHGYKINDVIDIMGYVISRQDFEKTFNISVDEILKGQDKLKSFIQTGEIDNDAFTNKTTFNIDEVLDKISRIGIDNLTKEEKDFLANYSRK